jgi:hypothetical protein
MTFGLEEDTVNYKGRVNVLESYLEPEMILIEVYAKDMITFAESSAGIRVTSWQARQLAARLNALAEKLENE